MNFTKQNYFSPQTNFSWSTQTKSPTQVRIIGDLEIVEPRFWNLKINLIMQQNTTLLTAPGNLHQKGKTFFPSQTSLLQTLFCCFLC